MKIRKLLKEWLAINEKLILFNKGARQGQVVVGAGGAASGKGWAITNFMDLSSYKIFDVDRIKELMIAVANKKGDRELADLDLRNPEDVAKLHAIDKERGISKGYLQTFLKSIDKKRPLPNLYFDKTLKDLSDFEGVHALVSGLGYEEKNMHLVWVLANFNVAFTRNASRPRVVPEDILIKTHQGAATTMGKILGGQLPKGFNGELYVILNNSEETEFQGVKGAEATALNTKLKPLISNFTYVKVKDSGKPISSDKEIHSRIADWINLNTPK